ncbi:MAG: hypothetical protein Kow0029_02350 [Candidatus Rifleibacteriota bacterium]
MKNELNWTIAEGKDFPMKFIEKGLDFSPKTAFFFYFSGMVAILSLLWVMALAVKLIYISQQDPGIPEYYKTVAFICIAISAASLYSFYKLYMDRRNYLKQIEIDKGVVNFIETTSKGKIEWSEKVKKYEGVYLKHYTYRGIDSWYIALVHSDSSKSFPVFAPDYDSKDVSEEEKRKLLAQYGNKFGLLTIYEKKKDKNEEDSKK